ncbi:MAG: SDR family oxidoreductase [Acidimicrobiales bacterium]
MTTVRSCGRHYRQVQSDIANGVVFLASDEAEYVNGVLLPIDGGMTCKLGIPDTSSLSAIEP